jgi:hypothetical protein
VFGYPLCEETYAASELILQEVMFAGIPPVVFPHGGIRDLVHNDFTGLVVRGPQEYAQAIEFLATHPDERQRLGRNAKNYAEQTFGAERAAEKINVLYRKLLTWPKKTRAWGTRHEEKPFEISSGAEKFLQTLINSREAFEDSLRAQETTQIIESDIDIMNMNDLFYAGGVLPFQNYYRSDPHLLFWCGLVHFGREHYEHAAMSFLSAIQNGFTHYRALWYLQKSLEIAGKMEDAQAIHRLGDAHRNVLSDFENKFLERLKVKSTQECSARG